VISLSTDQQARFRQAVALARALPALHQAVHNLYVALQDAIDLQNPRCDKSGRCCRFDEYGHRLFVTTAEVGIFLHDLHDAPQLKRPTIPHSAIHLPHCVFQQNNLCTVHAIRPLGCRIFFCDPSATDWQHRQYERFHAELRRLHEQWEVPYFYVEWREALGAVAEM
jgi:Fe-S-cluster containining protein